jgi:hypothetical protein
LHIKQPDHGLQSSFDTGLLLVFPTFHTKAVVGSDDIYIDALPHDLNKLDEDELPTPLSLPSDSLCHNVTQISGTSNILPKSDNNVLKHLRVYYSEVKTKCQLNQHVPAGFRQDSKVQRDFRAFIPPCKLRNTAEASSITPKNHSFDDVLHPINNNTATSGDETPAPVPNDSSLSPVPILRCVDKVSTSLLSWFTLSEDYIRASVGFCHIETIKGHLKDLHQDTVHLDLTPADAVLDKGVFATMKKCA